MDTLQKMNAHFFYLNNKMANQRLGIYFNSTTLQHNLISKYLEITQSRTLSYKQHLSNIVAVVHTRHNIIQKLWKTT